MSARVFKMVFKLHPAQPGAWGFDDPQALRSFWKSHSPELATEAWLDKVEGDLARIFTLNREQALLPKGKTFTGPWVPPTAYGIALKGDDGQTIMVLAEGDAGPMSPY